MKRQPEEKSASLPHFPPVSLHHILFSVGIRCFDERETWPRLERGWLVGLGLVGMGGDGSASVSHSIADLRLKVGWWIGLVGLDGSTLVRRRRHTQSIYPQSPAKDPCYLVEGRYALLRTDERTTPCFPIFLMTLFFSNLP